MRVVFSLSTHFADNNWSFGFPSARDFAYSAMLAVSLARRQAAEVAFYGDAPARAWAARLGLEFTHVYPAFEGFDYPAQLWALSKLHVYQQQTQPFFHLDFDAFLWRQLPLELHTAPVLAQSSEDDCSPYIPGLEFLFAHAGYIPAVVQEFHRQHGTRVVAVNTGIYGGRQLAVIRAAAAAAFDMLHHPANASMWALLAQPSRAALLGRINIILEQYLAGVYCFQHGLKPAYVVQPDQPQYFSHLLGDYKREPHAVAHLAQYVQLHYPAHHERILSVLP